MSVVESLSLAIPFALSHNFEDAERHPLDAANGEPVDWYKSQVWSRLPNPGSMTRLQVETSSTYGGKIAGWITGGLNFQVRRNLKGERGQQIMGTEMWSMNG
eukprot:766427-Hanusia_phi.AAC.3